MDFDKTKQKTDEIISYFNSIPTLSVKETIDFIETQNPGYKCPICGCKNFEILTSDGKYVDVIGTTKKIYVPNGHGQTITTDVESSRGYYIQLTCTHCFFVSLHNFVRLRNQIIEDRLKEAMNE